MPQAPFGVPTTEARRTKREEIRVVEILTTPPTGAPWFILDVMRRGKGHPRNAWAALLIDVDPEQHCSGTALATKSLWLELGKHPSFDDAWEHAEGLLGPRH